MLLLFSNGNLWYIRDKEEFVEFNVINVTFGGNYHEQGFFSWGIRTRIPIPI
jgi:hypothetical protein